jgi:hypothetical protein
MPTLQDYQDSMPTIFEVIPTLTKTIVENNFKKVPAPVAPAEHNQLTKTIIEGIFNDLLAKSTPSESIAHAGGIMALAGKYKISRADCVKVIQELEQGFNLYKSAN